MIDYPRHLSANLHSEARHPISEKSPAGSMMLYPGNLHIYFPFLIHVDEVAFLCYILSDVFGSVLDVLSTITRTYEWH